MMTALSGDTLTVERGADGTRVRPHSAKDKVLRVDRPTFEGKTKTCSSRRWRVFVAVWRGFFAY